MKKLNLEPIILLNDSYGIYIPQKFAQFFNHPENFFNYKKVNEDLNFLASEDSYENSDYWDIWEEILNLAAMLIDGHKYSLYQDGDLFAIPEGFNFDNFNN